jgi:hypothetical protein
MKTNLIVLIGIFLIILVLCIVNIVGKINENFQVDSNESDGLQIIEPTTRAPTTRAPTTTRKHIIQTYIMSDEEKEINNNKKNIAFANTLSKDTIYKYINTWIPKFTCIIDKMFDSSGLTLNNVKYIDFDYETGNIKGLINSNSNFFYKIIDVNGILYLDTNRSIFFYIVRLAHTAAQEDPNQEITQFINENDIDKLDNNTNNFLIKINGFIFFTLIKEFTSSILTSAAKNNNFNDFISTLIRLFTFAGLSEDIDYYPYLSEDISYKVNYRNNDNIVDLQLLNWEGRIMRMSINKNELNKDFLEMMDTDRNNIASQLMKYIFIGHRFNEGPDALLELPMIYTDSIDLLTTCTNPSKTFQELKTITKHRGPVMLALERSGIGKERSYSSEYLDTNVSMIELYNFINTYFPQMKGVINAAKNPGGFYGLEIKPSEEGFFINIISSINNPLFKTDESDEYERYLEHEYNTLTRKILLRWIRNIFYNNYVIIYLKNINNYDLFTINMIGLFASEYIHAHFQNVLGGSTIVDYEGDISNFVILIKVKMSEDDTDYTTVTRIDIKKILSADVNNLNFMDILTINKIYEWDKLENEKQNIIEDANPFWSYMLMMRKDLLIENDIKTKEDLTQFLQNLKKKLIYLNMLEYSHEF